MWSWNLRTNLTSSTVALLEVKAVIKSIGPQLSYTGPRGTESVLFFAADYSLI